MRNASSPAARALVLFAVLAAIALSACGSSSAATPCWKEIQNDWTNHTLGKTTYALSCYDLAIKKLPPDLFYYSSAPDQIHAAKLAAEQKKARRLAFSGGSRGSHNSGTGGQSGGGGNSSSPGATDETAVAKVLNVGTSSADSVPLPLIIVGALALLLLAAGAFGVTHRRLQARRADSGEPPA